uniref:Putative secreted peptide n=1 Tax=Anopheles braziliensis TaxID=58242 RepID=A0A2M3ZU92_9DIPT
MQSPPLVLLVTNRSYVLILCLQQGLARGEGDYQPIYQPHCYSASNRSPFGNHHQQLICWLSNSGRIMAGHLLAL